MDERSIFPDKQPVDSVKAAWRVFTLQSSRVKAIYFILFATLWLIGATLAAIIQANGPTFGSIVAATSALLLPITVAFGAATNDLQRRWLKDFETRRRVPRALSAWDGKAPLLLQVPRQGVSIVWSNLEEAAADVEAWGMRWNASLLKWKEEPSFDRLLGPLPDIIPRIPRILDDIASGVRSASIALLIDFERTMDQLGLPAPTGVLGSVVLDRDTPLDHAIFVLSTYFDPNLAAGAVHDRLLEGVVDFTRTDLLKSFRKAFTSFQTSGGEAAVMFRLATDATVALSTARQTVGTIVDLESRLRGLIEQAEAKLQLRPAATRWRQSARWNMLGAAMGLTPFIATLALIAIFFPSISEALQPFWTANEPSLSSVALLSVPVLFVAWVLRHFSRLFVQNINLAADNSRRAAYASVYALLVGSGNITDEQKRIIFEAMFRPDPHHGDVGVEPHPALQMIKDIRKTDQ